jgi:site-specific recombinase XerC
MLFEFSYLNPGKPQTVKQHLAAIRKCFDYMVLGQIIDRNPAHAVRGPKHVVKRGKTPILSAKDTRKLLDSISDKELIGIRDRALLGLMVFSFARISAVLGMNVDDFYKNQGRYWVRLHEKGGKFHEIPVHRAAESFVRGYIKACRLDSNGKVPLFQTMRGFSKELSGKRLHRTEALAMIKRRVKAAGLSSKVSCHSFGASGITAYLESGGSLENAQAIAAHESPRTTKLHDRRSEKLVAEEIDRIKI